MNEWVAKRLLLGLLDLDGVDTGSLLGESESLPLSGDLVPRSSGLHLVGEQSGSELLGLGLVDVLQGKSRRVEEMSFGPVGE